MNDDNFLGKRLYKRDVLSNNYNKVRTFFDSSLMKEDNLNGKLLNKYFKPETRHNYLHQLYVFDSKILDKIHHDFPEQIHQTLQYKFRSPHAYSVKILHSYIGYYLGLTEPTNIPPSDISLIIPKPMNFFSMKWGKGEPDRLTKSDLDLLETMLPLGELINAKFFCIQHAPTVSNSLNRRYEKIVMNYLRSVFPG